VRLLEYKADWNDKRVIKINRFFPSSKTCGSCGWINQNLNLSDREWICKCGITHDRDLNAARNILKEGQKIIGTELSDYTLRGKNQTSAKKHKPMKSEAHLSLANG
jgi:putative transposase